ncbi:hypothetical protein A2634_03065 [Candidatus Amesbacteria bacterium RIFCSPHIGHO2_01_FULL_48_32]|uniref:Uncharacterized protein n=1 Tax=Candidatus Amesbacteria bacterium RIFCSPLOWO2_01_FULL_48_25 TaxID=1797259 RepID=A0A1F4ZB70_9BACT|nr:MAG: hypothetical protein A2634_03065 [Candidatus Amesbacteria bacterium RIFCSPHIGHO2_01_FULL_48_32]OGD03610.1 MAG: hypothetical protein A2989_02925 [Candidatus Amesbacteria bacterium RIFCSPLOWO2_01_FULL_48_25]HJZ04441.1 hypothetical protein [Patescibacteria group bacterium]
MVRRFPKAQNYLDTVDWMRADELDRIARELLNDGAFFERVDDVLGRKFRHGKTETTGMDRDGRLAKIRRETLQGKWFRYMIEGANGQWYEPEEKIWVLAMVELFRRRKKTT